MVNQPESPDVAVLAVSQDAQFVASLREALQGSRELLHAPDMATAENMVISHEVGVVVTDRGTSQQDIASVASQLRPIVPQLVLVVAGDRSHANDMLDLINRGDIYRFLLTPLAPGQTRVCIESAISRYHAITDAAPEVPESISTPTKSPIPRVLAATIAAVSLAATAWWFVGQDSPPATPVAQPATPEAPDTGPPLNDDPERSREAAVDRSLSLARDALATGRLVEPIGANALYFFRSVLKAQPKHAEAREGLKTIARMLLEQTAEALDNGERDAARASLAVVRGITPDDPAVSELQQRLGSLDTRTAIDAAQRLAQAQDFSGALALLAEQPDRPDIEAARVTIGQAQQAAQVEASLQRMALQIATDNLLEPADDSAHFHAMASLRIQPENPQVLTAVSGLADLLVERASEATAAGDFDGAKNWLAAADALGVSSTAVSDGRAANRDAAAEQQAAQAEAASNAQRLSLAAERIAAGQLLEPADDSAYFYLGQVRASDPGYGGLIAAETQLADALLVSANQGIADGRYDDATRLLETAEALGAGSNAVAVARASLNSALTEQAAQQPDFVSTRELTRTRHVAPEYPVGAQRRGQEGSVLLEFTLAQNGTVQDIEVVESRPGSVFNRAATSALSRWEFEPYQVDGEPQEIRVRVDMSFVMD